MSEEIGVHDKQGVDVLLASRLPAARKSTVPCAWVCLDTEFAPHDIAWYTFGYPVDVRYPVTYMTSIKKDRPRRALLEVGRLLEDRAHPRVFVDSTYTTNRKLVDRHAHHDLTARLLRLKMMYPLQHLPVRSEMEELRRLTDRVVDVDQRREDGMLPGFIKLREDLMGGARMVMQMNPALNMWDQVYVNTAMVVSGRAALYGRPGVVQAEDVMAAYRVLKDSIPWWTRRVLDCVRERGNGDGEKGWSRIERIREYTGLDSVKIRPVLNALVQSGALVRKQQFYRIRDRQVRDFLNGTEVKVWAGTPYAQRA